MLIQYNSLHLSGLVQHDILHKVSEGANKKDIKLYIQVSNSKRMQKFFKWMDSTLFQSISASAVKNQRWEQAKF